MCKILSQEDMDPWINILEGQSPTPQQIETTIRVKVPQ